VRIVGTSHFNWYLDQFISGLNKFEGLFTNTVDTGPDGDVLLTIPPSLHRQGSITLFVGEGSIERERLCRKTVSSNLPITGRTLLRLAKEVLANCKKMMALVMSPNSPYKDGDFPSGTNWDDYAKWCLDSMYRQDVEDKQGTAVLPATEVNDEGGPLPAGVVPPTTHQEVEMGEQHEASGAGVLKFPLGYFFRGFLAWCLWGHIPIVENGSTTMRSFLFTDGKASTSFGRKKGMMSKKRPPSSAAGTASVKGSMHKRSKRQHENGGGGDNEDEEYEMLSMSTTTSITTGTATQRQPPVVTRGMLSTTIAIMKHESVEKELQKTNHLEVRILRDKMAAVNRKYDHLSKRYYGMITSTMQQGHDHHASPFLLDMEREMNAYQKEMGELELELEVMQRSEVTRRGQAIALLRQSMVADDDKNKSSFLAAVVAEPSGTVVFDPTTNAPHTVSGGCVPYLTSTSPLTTGTADDHHDRDFLTPMPAATATVNHSDGPGTTRKTTSTVCIECSIMPSTHQCRRCKQYVCATCCSSKRGLEMIWWCGTCFEQESITTQDFIRAGNYNSDSSASGDA
jgi:hypothetical protein